MSILDTVKKLVKKPFRRKTDGIDLEDYDDYSANNEALDDYELPHQTTPPPPHYERLTQDPMEEQQNEPEPSIGISPSDIYPDRDQYESPLPPSPPNPCSDALYMDKEEAPYRPPQPQDRLESSERMDVKEEPAEKKRKAQVILDKFNSLATPVQIGIMALPVIVIIGLVVIGNMDSSSKSTVAQPQDQMAAESMNPQGNNKNRAANNPAGGQPAAGPGATPMGALAINPFVDIGQLGQLGQQTGQTKGQLPMIQVPAISQGNGNSIMASRNLPAIPAIPRPDLPQIQAPKMPPGGSPSGASSNSKPTTVQGIMTGADGENMAILSDGSVVTAGESFNDNRIAWIGGDGVKFDDGSSLQMTK